MPVEVRVAVADPFVAYRCTRSGPWTTDAPDGRGEVDGVCLETTGGQPGWGYFAVDPVSRLQVGPILETAVEVDRSPALAELAGLLDAETLVRGDCDVPYPCGAFGWLSYDAARELESLPETTDDDGGLPNLQLGVFDRVAAWEEPRRPRQALDRPPRREGRVRGAPRDVRGGPLPLALRRARGPPRLAGRDRVHGRRTGVVMGVRHRERPHEGVQFHPESILTPVGMGMVEAFVRGCRNGG